MNLTNTKGIRVIYIGCTSRKNGRFIPEGYPEFNNNPNGFGWFIDIRLEGIEMTNCNSLDNLKDGLHVKDGVTGIFIAGGTFTLNGKSGIALNGIINKFRISPSLVEKNLENGLVINGNMTNGFIKDSIITENINGINKISGTLSNVIVKDNLVYENSSQNLINITQN